MPTPMELLEFDYINPIKCIYHRPVGKKFVVSHWHESIEIVYVLKGNPGTVTIEGQTFQLHEGEVYVINSRLIHSFETYITDDKKIVTLLINYEWLRHCLPQTVRNKNFELIKGPQNSKQQPAFDELVILINRLKDFQFNNQEGNRLHQLSVEVELISILIENFLVDKEFKSEIPPVISDIITGFYQNYSHEVQLSEVAKNYNYSYAYFSKMFKRYLGISPKKYLTLLRIQKAAELIEDTDYKFAQIALQTGFPDEKSFYASFKEQYHQTPLEYRKKTQLL